MCCVQGKHTEHLPSMCIRIVFLYVHSPNKGSCVEAPIRVPHDATECGGEVLNPCRSHGMTVSDTVCSPNVLCRSILSSFDSVRIDKSRGRFPQHVAWPVGVRVFRTIAFTIVRALCGRRRCLINMERRKCICICLMRHLVCKTALRFLSNFACYGFLLNS